MVGVQGLSRRRRLHPCHVANAGVGSAHGFDKPPRGGRVVGGRCAKGTHFRGYGFIAANGLAQSVVSTPMQPVGRRLVSSPTPHRLLNYFQMLVQGLSMSLS